MSHTNSTTNYGLPQFLTSDKPAWLTDVNNAFSDIDTAVYNAQTKADTAFTDAGNAQLDATTAINNASAADAKGSGALASIETTFDPTTIYSVGAKVIYNSLLYRCIVAVTTPGPWTGSDNWERITVDSLISTTDSKIGQLTSLSTSDKTSIVNAVNELNGNKADRSELINMKKVNGVYFYTIALASHPILQISHPVSANAHFELCASAEINNVTPHFYIVASKGSDGTTVNTSLSGTIDRVYNSSGATNKIIKYRFGAWFTVTIISDTELELYAVDS